MGVIIVLTVSSAADLSVSESSSCCTLIPTPFAGSQPIWWSIQPCLPFLGITWPLLPGCMASAPHLHCSDTLQAASSASCRFLSLVLMVMLSWLMLASTSRCHPVTAVGVKGSNLMLCSLVTQCQKTGWIGKWVHSYSTIQCYPPSLTMPRCELSFLLAMSQHHEMACSQFH